MNLNWQDYVKIDKSLVRPVSDNFGQSGNQEAQQKLGWHPEVKFDQLVEIMVNEDMIRWKRHLNGESFPWDIHNLR